MIYPKGEAVYENLNTSFTQLNVLLAELKSNQHTGYVRVTAWEYEGTLWLDIGNVVNAVEVAKGQRQTGPAAAAAITARARYKEGMISVYRLPEETVQLVASAINGAVVHKNLASDFTSLDKLIAKLEGERHTGYLEIQMNEGTETASVFMNNGRTVECFLARSGDVAAGKALLKQIMGAVSSAPALYTVYRTDPEQVYRRSAEQPRGSARHEMLALWHQTLNFVRTAWHRLANTGAFLSTINRVPVQPISAYPFADPFSAEFQYRDGQVRFAVQATADQFNGGLSQCLALAILALAKEPRTTNVVQMLQPAMAELTGKFGQRPQETDRRSASPALPGK